MAVQQRCQFLGARARQHRHPAAAGGVRLVRGSVGMVRPELMQMSRQLAAARAIVNREIAQTGSRLDDETMKLARKADDRPTHPVLRHEGVALWRQIASHLQQDIGAGQLSAGRRACPPRRSCRTSSRSTATRCAARWRNCRAAAWCGSNRGAASFVAEDVLEYAVEPRTRFSEWISGITRNRRGACCN